MTSLIRLLHDYEFPAQRVWEVVTDLGHLRTVAEGLVTFRDLPSGRIFQGQRLHVHVSLFGWLPYQPYEMHVAVCDNSTMTFTSEEHGVGVTSWKHILTVVPRRGGCQVIETIELDAPPMTPLLAAWARFMYRRRHARRLRILSSHIWDTPAS